MHSTIRKLTILGCAVVLTACAAQNMSTQVTFQDVSSIPAPRSGAVYVGLRGDAKKLDALLNSSGHLTTVAPTQSAQPAFYIDATQSSRNLRNESNVLVPAFLLTIIPMSGVDRVDWDVKISSVKTRTPLSYSYSFRRKGYIALLPHAYLFGRPLWITNMKQGGETIVQSEMAHVVSNIINEANRKGLLSQNK
jgi:hypothetical protein